MGYISQPLVETRTKPCRQNRVCDSIVRYSGSVLTLGREQRLWRSCYSERRHNSRLRSRKTANSSLFPVPDPGVSGIRRHVEPQVLGGNQAPREQWVASWHQTARGWWTGDCPGLKNYIWVRPKHVIPRLRWDPESLHSGRQVRHVTPFFHGCHWLDELRASQPRPSLEADDGLILAQPWRFVSNHERTRRG